MTGRIRTVKPEWLDDEKLGAASDAARMLSVGLMLLADDHGRGRAHPLYIASRVWPYGDPREVLQKVSGALQELDRIGFVRLYDVTGQSYFAIRNWGRHQKVQHPSAPRVPEPPPEDETPPPAAPAAAANGGKRRGKRASQEGRNVSSGDSHESRASLSGDSHEVLTPDLRSPTPITDPDPDLVGPNLATRRDASPRPSSDPEERIATLEGRYPGGLAAAARAACARRRRSGRMAPAVWLATLEKLDAYAPEIVVGALTTFVDRYSTGEHDERYLLGIVRGESERGTRANGWRPPTTREEYAAAATSDSELAAMFDSVTDEDRARIERLGNRRAHG